MGMPSEHSFRVGEIVAFAAMFYDLKEPPEHFEIVRLLPCEGEGPSYVIKSLRDAHQRVVLEQELERAAPIVTI